MHKRILSLLLAAVVLLSLIPAFALPSKAVSNMTTSERCIEILKEMEGFLEYPVYDYSHYSVGYGSSCEKDDYPNGITEEEADALLREFLAEMEKDINKFANRYDILFSQNQFDALMLFTYNCGSNWVNSDGEFRKAVIENKTGNSFIYAMTLWSTAGNQLSKGLLKRRMIEADMYLNGSYTNSLPDSYTYVTYNNNGGAGQSRGQGYDCNLPAYAMSVPTREGYVFLGWYSAAEGGSWITELTEANAEQELVAHWQSADTDPAVGTAAAYQIPAQNLLSLEYYDVPGGTVTGSLSQDSLVPINADYVDADGLKWGRISMGSWVKLGDPRVGTGDDTEEVVGVEVTVTGDYVNVRTGPGTGYPVVSMVVEGDVIFVTQTTSLDGVLWGRFRGGWVCLQYTDYSGGLTPSEPAPEEDTNESAEPIAIGTVTAAELNIRAYAGTSASVVGCYRRGAKVEILEKTMVGTTPWGRTDRGWICLSYVKLEEIVQEEPEQETTAPTESETTEPEQEETQPADKPATQQGIPATVISKSGLNIRSGPGTQYAGVGSYASGASIRILEQRTVGGVAWGRTDRGWVCMQYVRLSDTWTNENGVYGVVTSSGLNIRSGAGVGFAPVGSYAFGTRILVYEQVVASGQKWGRTADGWVCMAYVRLEESAFGTSQETQPEETTTPTETTDPTEPSSPEQENTVVTGTVTAGGLNIRKTPGTTGAIVGGYVKGNRVTILEQVQVNGTTWGRTDRGWISLAYVKLDVVEDNQTADGYSGVITASALCIRKGPGTANAILGTYSRGDVVKILETVKVGTTTWGRTDKGWICMDYVQAVAVPDTGDDEEPSTETTAPEEEPTVETTEPEEEPTVETTAPEEEPTVETTEPEEEPTVETTAPEEEPTVETTEPEEEPTVETTEPEVTEPVAVFDFTCEDYVAALNTELETYEIVAKAIDSGMEGVNSYEFVAISDGGSYGVVMYIELAEDGKKAAGVMMACNAADEIACDNLSVFASYAMLLVDGTITDADLEAMMSDPVADEDGNQYFIMERASGEFAFVVTADLLYFYVYPVA